MKERDQYVYLYGLQSGEYHQVRGSQCCSDELILSFFCTTNTPPRLLPEREQSRSQSRSPAESFPPDCTVLELACAKSSFTFLPIPIMSKAAHRSTKSFKVSMKPSTISQISLDGEDELLSLIHELNGCAEGENGLEERETFQQLSNSSKKDLARTLIRNDRRISNQQKQERFLHKQIEKASKIEPNHLTNSPLESQVTLVVRLESCHQSRKITFDRLSTLTQLNEACQRLYELSELDWILYFQSEALVESDILTIPSESLLTLRRGSSFDVPEIKRLTDSELLSAGLGLPILNEPVRSELLKAIDQNSAIVLVGETGCG